MSTLSIKNYASNLSHTLDYFDSIRIKTHLRLVEKELRAKDVTHLTPLLRQRRAKNLDHLHTYWTTGLFPKNTNHPDQFVPYFKDRYGTPCAMAYLIEQSGRYDLVSEVARTDNNVKIMDITEGPVLDWIYASGLTQAEAARIQPTYGPCGMDGICSEAELLQQTLRTWVPLLFQIGIFILLEYFVYRFVTKKVTGGTAKKVVYFLGLTVASGIGSYVLLLIVPLILYIVFLWGIMVPLILLFDLFGSGLPSVVVSVLSSIESFINIIMLW